MAEPRILLLCSSRFAVLSMQSMIFFKQLAVVCVPSHCDEMIEGTKQLLKDTGVPLVILRRNSFEKKLIELIGKYKIDTGMIITFSFKLPASVYKLPANGFYNIHPGPLPQYRGMDPVFQMIRKREKNAGVTLHKVDSDFDTGPVVINEMIRLDPNDTHGMLNEKLAMVAAKLTGVLIKLLGLGIEIPLKVQDESKAVYYKKHGQADVCINWHVMEARSVIALINACNPWNKGAITKLNGKIIRLMEAAWIESPGTEQLPGTILGIDDRGIIISSLNNEAVLASLIYMDEGFLLGKRLLQWGFRPGARFSHV